MAKAKKKVEEINSANEPLDAETLAEMATETLRGDVRDFLLDRVRNIRKPWNTLSEEDQSDQINAADDAAKFLIERVALLIASEGRKVVVAHVEQVVFKDAVKAVLNLPKDSEYRHELADAVGCQVLVICTGVEEMQGEKDTAKPDPDQTSLVE